MYNNIGKKIKTVANVLAVVGIVISIILGIVFFMAWSGILNAFSDKSAFDSYARNSLSGLVIGFLIAGGGSFVSWISNFLLYGYGELIDCAQDVRIMLAEQFSYPVEDENGEDESPSENELDDK